MGSQSVVWIPEETSGKLAGDDREYSGLFDWVNFVRIRIFTLLSAISAVICLLSITAWFCAGRDPREFAQSLFCDCYVTVAERGYCATIEFFNNPSYGPYRGSLVGLENSLLNPKVIGFGPSAGIYYRWIEWPDGHVLWTLSVNVLYPILCSGILPLAWAIWSLRRQCKSMNEDHV